MLPAHEFEAITIHLEEIKALALETDPTRAIKRTLDFARDYSDGRSFENEAVSLSSQLNRVRDADRKGLRTPAEIDASLARIVSQLLELADKIYDGFVAKNDESTKSDTAPALNLVEGSQPPQMGGESKPARTASVTSFEEARQRYKKKWHEGDGETIAFRCSDITKRFDKSSKSFLLSGISIELQAGEITGMVGVNGAGKTTLLRIIAGEIAPSGGEVSYPLLDKGKLDWRAIRHNIGYVQQLPEPWYGTLADNLYLHAANHGLKRKEIIDETEFMLHRLGLEMYRDATWSQISGGYKMRFELARALVGRPKLLILDEPLAPLDVVTQQLFLKDLRDLANSLHNPLPIIVTSQHLYEIESIADVMLFLDDGKPIFYGPPSEIGKNRKFNMFEVACSLSSTKLYDVLGDVEGIYMEDFGLRQLIQVARNVSVDDILTRLVTANANVRYFRDISRSSRMLFDTKVGSV